MGDAEPGKGLYLDDPFFGGCVQDRMEEYQLEARRPSRSCHVAIQTRLWASHLGQCSAGWEEADFKMSR